MAKLGSSGGDLRTPLFNGTNYYFWVVKMETILISHDLWNVVEHGFLSQLVCIDETSEDDEREITQIPVEAPIVSKEEKKILKKMPRQSHSRGKF